MPNRLQATRYTGPTYSGIEAAETISDISELKFRWSIPGGVNRIELTVPAKSRYGAYDRYENHLGHRLAVFDQYLDRPICSGQIFEIIPDGRHVTYICAGPWKRTYDDVYYTGNFPATGNTDAIIKDVLTDSVSIDSTDQTNIDGSSVAIGGWTPDPNSGTFAGDAIADLARIGDSSDNIMDFYFVEQPFAGTQMQAPLPYLKSRSLTAAPDWIFSIEDLAPNGLTLARNIWNLKTTIRIGYGRLAGTDDGADNDTLVDSGEDFIASGVQPGDRVVNLTDDAVYVVDTVATTVLTFTDGATGLWGNGDQYSIRLREPLWTAATTPTSNYWAVEYREVRREMDATQAAQYRDQLFALYDDAQQQQSFIVSSPTIKDGNGAVWPLWRPFSGTSFYFRISDIFPEAAIFGNSDDRKNTFMAVAMDYTYSNNRLRVVPSTKDSRLDSLLNQAKIIQGEIVSTEAAWRAAKREEEGHE